MSDRLVALCRRRLFSVEGATYTWADVLTWARARGSLDELGELSRRGLARARRAQAVHNGLEAEARSSAAREFRYRRRLLSAEELDAWLTRWQLTVREWGDYLDRTLLLEQSADDLGLIEADSAVTEDADEVEFIDAVCSGFLEREAHGFAADVALAELTADEATGGRTLVVARTLAAAAAARENAKSPPSVERVIATRWLDWTRLDLDVLEFVDGGAAREAALCVRIDGRGLDEVAADCRTPMHRQGVYVTDLEPVVRATLLAAQPGELVGPVETEGRFSLFAIRARTAATSTDPSLRLRAEAVLVEDAVRRAVEERVEWHEHI